MKKISLIILSITILIATGFVYSIFNDDSNVKVEINTPFNYSEGLILMQNQDTKEFNCFGCNDVMCKDPAPIMQQVNESDEIYCDKDFNVIKNVKIKNDFGTRLVYESFESFNISDYQNDCNKRGGTFNECGSACAPDSEMCVMMCVLSCESIK